MIPHDSKSEIARRVWFPLRAAAGKEDDLRAAGPTTMSDYTVMYNKPPEPPEPGVCYCSFLCSAETRADLKTPKHRSRHTEQREEEDTEVATGAGQDFTGLWVVDIVSCYVYNPECP